MKRIARSSSFALPRLRISPLIYVILIIVSSLNSAEINNHNGSKTTYKKEGSDSIKSAKKSAISRQQDGNNKIDVSRNYSASESSVISGEKNSIALNRFLDDVLKAQNDLKWIDHAARRFDQRARLDNPLAHTNQHSTVSVNTEDVLGRADISYESRLRGKRGFDRNYETMWMLQKKKYAEENIRGAPHRIYLDNDMTFKRDADSADFAPYQSPSMLDRSVYERGTIADQPLKDWTRKKDLHSLGHWPNSNENLEVTNGEDTWLRDYKPAREIFVNSDLIKNEKKSHVDADMRDPLLFDPMHADDLTALRESPIAIAKIAEKSQDASGFSLESLRKTILELRNSLIFGDRRESVISREKSKWWSDPRLTAEIFDFEKRDLDNNPDEGIMWRIRRNKNLADEDETTGNIYRDLKESHDRSKRKRRSFTADNLNCLNNQANILENKSHQTFQTIKDTFGNITRIQKSENLFKLNSTYPDKRNSMNASNQMNISESQYFLKGESSSSNYLIDLTIIPLMNNKTEISRLKYPLNTKSYLSDYSTDSGSLLFAKSDRQTHSLEHVAINKVSSTSSKEINQNPTTEVLKSIRYTTKICANLSNSEKSLLADSTNNDVIGDSQKSMENGSDDEKLGIAAWKISRHDGNDGQSNGAGEKFPRGNTSRGFGTAANESRSCVVETTASERRRGGGEGEANETQKENGEPIPSMIKVFELREHPFQKQEAETAARLFWRIEGDGTSVAKMKTNDVDESRNANAREGSSSLKSIDPVTDATARPKAASINTELGESIISKDQREELVSTIADNNLRKQQQMVPPLSTGNRKANKSNGNLDTDGIDIRALGSNGNETMNVKGDTRTTMEAHEYPESGNNLRRKLLWISVDAETEDAPIENAKSNLNATSGRRIENVIQEDRQQSNIIFDSPKSNELMKVKRENDAKESSTLQNALSIETSDINLHARYKRAAYSFENPEVDNEVDSENVAAEKEEAINHDEKQENNEEYLNQDVEELKEDYNDGEEDAEDNDKEMENARGERSSARQQINPVKAKVDMLIKEKLDKNNKKCSNYNKRKKRMSDMIEYYDYEDDEGQRRDALINEREINKFSTDDKAKIKREDKIPCGLGKKKDENAEEMMKRERQKIRAKNKEPKEEVIVDLGEHRNKTVKISQNKKLSNSSGSNFEGVFNEEARSFTEENSENVQSEDLANNVYREELADARSKWMTTSENSESAFDNQKKKVRLNEHLGYTSNQHIDANPDIIENIVLDIQPIKILDQSKELEVPKNLYEDFENKRSEDDYYDQDNDRKDSNNVKPLYEELKNVYDWPDGELKSGPRLRGDQRLRYELDNKLDTNPSQLQPLNDGFFSSNQNNDASRRFYSSDASRTSLSDTPTNNYFALKATDDMIKDNSEQNRSAEKSSNIFSDSVTSESKIPKITKDKNSPFSKESTIERPAIDTDSDSLYENRKYTESATRKVLKRNLNTEKQAAISLQDLHESFIESLDWHDDFDDNVNIRLGRGLKAIDETVISHSIKTRERNKKLDIANTTDVSSKLRISPPLFHDNSSTLQNWYNNTITDLINIFNVHHDASDQSIEKPVLTNMGSDEDFEVAEQKYVNHQASRIKRTAPSYRAFYDDMNHNQRDSEKADRNLDDSDSFQLSNILEDRSDGVYDGHVAPHWSNDIEDLDPYLKMPRSTNSKKKKKTEKMNKHFSDKHAKENNLHSFLSRNRRYHTHRSDIPKNADRGDWKKKDKSEASSLTGHTKVQKSKIAEQGYLRAGINETSGEKVLYENAEDQSTVKSEADNARRKEITLLLAADNVDDESQMDVALHGELAGKIVEQIFEQVQKNDQLKNVLAPGLHRNYKTEDVIVADNIYRQGFNDTGINHTETMMKRIMELLDKLILNEVQRKTCVFLSSDMREFLGWMLQVDQEEELFEEALPLPLVHEEIIPEQDSKRKFLFDATSVREGEEDISNLRKKVKVLETLVKEYNALTTKEKTEVQTVHDYLIRQLNQLLRYIEAREGKFASMPFGATRARTGILQYQSAMPNVTNASYLTTKDVLFSPIDTSFKVADRQFHDSHVEPHRREIRSLDKVSTKPHRKTKHQKIHNNRKNANRKKSIKKRKKHRKHQDRTRSSLGFGKTRRKRVNLKKNDSHYLGYERPTIYDSFDLLNAKLMEKKRKRKRELVDKKNAATENDRMLDLLPIKGKNRLEDEVILLNKREAWKRENEKQLEEVAFGKDMRNIGRGEKERFEKLAEGDKRKAIDEASFRMKREGIIRGISTVRGADRSDKTHTASEIGSSKSEKNLESKDDNGNNGARKDKLELVERRINVFADNRSNAATDTAVAEVSTREKLAINAGANNQVKGKLCGINRETKIDKAVGSTSRANLTSDTKPRVSVERQKVSEAEKEADDNAVKLNQMTNYRSEETNPEIELKNLRREREGRIYGVADRRMTDSFYDDDNLARNKFRKKYVAKLDEPGNLDARSENNLELLRLRSYKWSNDVVGWKLLPVMKRSPYYDDRAFSRIRLMEKEIPSLNYVKDVELEPNVHLSDPKLWRFKQRRRKRNKIRLINDNDTSSRGIHSKAKQAFEIARFKDPRINSKIFLKARKLARLSNGKKSNSVAEFAVPFMLKTFDRETSRSRNDPELGDPMIYDEIRLPVWSYYDDLPIFHFVPDIRRRDGDVYRYPAGVYLEYGPFKKRARDLNRRIARQNRFRLRTIEEEAVDFSGDNLGNKSAESRFAHGKFRVKTDEPALANHEDYFASNETKDTQKKSNKTKIELKE